MEESFFPDQKITRGEALRCYTINNARLTFEEEIKGSIEPSKLADLVVLSHDILTCSEDQIKDIQPLMTIVRGKIVYEHKKLTIPHSLIKSRWLQEASFFAKDNYPLMGKWYIN